MVQNYSMNHHYLHNIAAKISMGLFGDAPWAVRLPAMLLGMGTLAAMWFLARDIAGSAIAHITTLLLALSYHEIWFSQNARGYTGLAFFSTLGMILFLRGMTAPTRKIWVLYGLCLAAAVFTHLTGAFFFMAQGVLWLGIVITRAVRGGLDAPTLRLPFLGFLIGGLITVLLYLPILPSLYHTVSTVAEGSATDVMQEYQNPIWTAAEAIRTGIGQAGPLVALVGVAVLVLSLLGAVALHRDAPYFAPITFLSIGLTVALLMVVGMRIWPRFFFIDIGFLMLLIVMGVRLSCAVVALFLGGERVSRGLFVAAVIAMVAISAFLAKRNYDFPKQDLIGAYNLVEDMRSPGDRVFSVGHTGPIFSEYFKADWPVIFTNDEYDAAMAEPGPVIFVIGFPARSFRDVPQLATDRNMILSEVGYLRGTLGDGDFVILKRD
jgi:4-amino-4-deoxy-L-arabinose transferase-like glycosyltransferase